jgi:hypothetical protein
MWRVHAIDKDDTDALRNAVQLLEHPSLAARLSAGVGTSGRLYLCTINSQAAHFAKKPARAFFPSLVASAMVSKKTDDRFTGPDRPAR